MVAEDRLKALMVGVHQCSLYKGSCFETPQPSSSPSDSLLRHMDFSMIVAKSVPLGGSMLLVQREEGLNRLGSLYYINLHLKGS